VRLSRRPLQQSVIRPINLGFLREVVRGKTAPGEERIGNYEGKKNALPKFGEGVFG
jgi:hypothetical protein